MEESFNTFSRKTPLYYILISLSASFFLFLFICGKYNSQLPKSLVIIVTVIGLIAIVSYMLLSASNLVPFYIRDGELTLSAEAIKINSIVIPFSDIERIEIGTNDYVGARASDGSGNKIEITKKDRSSLKYKFVIESKTQRDSLRDIIDKWKQQGLHVEPFVF